MGQDSEIRESCTTQAEDMFNIPEIRQRLQKMLPAGRFAHTLGVAVTALELARRYGINDANLIETAALLHDCGKAIPGSEIIAYARTQRIPIEADTAMLGPELYHCEVGEYIALERFGIRHPLVTEAIRYHATGKPGMADSTKLIFMADCIEPTRSFPGIEELRRYTQLDFADALKQIARFKLHYLLDNNRQIHPRAVQTWNDLNKRLF